MTRRLPATPAPGPLEDYAARFDDLFGTLAQRQAFRRYLEGLLLPTERNKTLTALANTEPVVGAQRKEAQGLQWFLSESSWDPERINRRRVELLLEDPKTAPREGGALVIDETGDRKDGKKTAHIGKQYLGGIGKIDDGVVSVSSLWADERIYYPLEVEPYTPAHHFSEGKADPGFRTKQRIALELVEQAVQMEIPFRAVVADILYGEHREFKEGLENRHIPYVLAIKPSYAWYRPIGEPGSVEEIARLTPWKGDDDPGEWVELERTFRDGRTERWWALEAECRPFGVEKRRRLVVATTDPAELPDLSTWYLVSNLPAPGTKRAEEGGKMPAADAAEVVRLYSLRSWIEQSYKQVKNSLGWAQYRVRKDLAIRRHWQLVCCAFTFCWWTNADFLEGEAPPGVILKGEETATTSTPPMVERGKKEDQEEPAPLVLAGGAEEGKEMAGAIRNALALLEGILREAPARGVKRVA
jgi:DDE superfamily endonuclease